MTELGAADGRDEGQDTGKGKRRLLATGYPTFIGAANANHVGTRFPAVALMRSAFNRNQPGIERKIDRMSNIFLHIGMPKSGSTFIQKFLNENQNLLKNYGLFYPEFSIKNTHQSSKSHENHLLLYLSLRKAFGDEAVSTKIKIKSNLYETLENANHVCDELKIQNTIISSEGFWNLSSQILRDIKFFLSQLYDKTIIVCFIRRQDYLIESFYNHRTRLGLNTLQFPDYVSEVLRNDIIYNDYPNTISYEKRILELTDIFGLDNVCVNFIDERSESKNIIYELFSSIFSADDASNILAENVLQIDQKKRNSKINTEFTEYIRKVCSGIPESANRILFAERALMSFTQQDSDQKDEEIYSLYTEELRQDVVNHYLDGNEIIFRVFGNKVENFWSH